MSDKYDDPNADQDVEQGDDKAAGGAGSDNTDAQNKGTAPGTGDAGEGAPADGGWGTSGGDASGTGR